MFTTQRREQLMGELSMSNWAAFAATGPRPQRLCCQRPHTPARLTGSVKPWALALAVVLLAVPSRGWRAAWMLGRLWRSAAAGALPWAFRVFLP